MESMIYVVVISTSIQEIDDRTQNQQCGNNTIMLQSLSSTAELINAVRNSTAEVDLNDAASLTPVTGQYNRQLKVVGQSYNIQPFGILCNTQNQSLCCVFVTVLNYLIQQGTYEQLLKTYSYSYIHQEFVSVVERVYQNVHQFLAFVKLN